MSKFIYRSKGEETVIYQYEGKTIIDKFSMMDGYKNVVPKDATNVWTLKNRRIEFSIEEQVEKPSQSIKKRRAIKKIKTAKFTFKRLGIPIGAKLEFMDTEGEICPEMDVIVISEKRGISYKGKKYMNNNHRPYALSGLATKFMERHVSGSDHYSYKGVRLCDIRAQKMRADIESINQCEFTETEVSS